MHGTNTLREKCIAAVGSMTAAIKAQRTLSLNGISSEIVALDPGRTRRGCAYGVEFLAEDERAVRATLRGGNVSVSEYIR
ncbi:MAG: DUF3343 domain-containing protein [Clostridia bacterium]|nr:DUF3343 domain-containing protein [Clostridia bacterium]